MPRDSLQKYKLLDLHYIGKVDRISQNTGLVIKLQPPLNYSLENVVEFSLQIAVVTMDHTHGSLMYTSSMGGSCVQELGSYNSPVPGQI